MVIGICSIIKVSINGESPECGVSNVPTPTPPPGPPINWSGLPQGLNSGQPTVNLQDVASDGINFVAVGDNGRAALSIDGGLNWTPLPQGLNSGNPNAAFKCIAAGEDGVFVAAATSGWSAISTDGGVNWSAAQTGLGSSGTNNFIRIATDNNGNWLVVGESANAGFSIDNGVTWNDAGTISGLGTPTYRGIKSMGPNAKFLVTTDNGGAGITTDAGATFGSFLLPQGLNSGDVNNNFRSPAIVNGNIIASGAGLLGSFSQDDGSTWIAAPSGLNSQNPGPQSFGDCDSDTRLNMVSVQENGYASYSPDKGETWINLIQGLNSGLADADFNGVGTNNIGTWIAVADTGYASIGLQCIPPEDAIIKTEDQNINSDIATDDTELQVLFAIGQTLKPTGEIYFNFIDDPGTFNIRFVNEIGDSEGIAGTGMLGDANDGLGPQFLGSIPMTITTWGPGLQKLTITGDFSTTQIRTFRMEYQFATPGGEYNVLACSWFKFADVFNFFDDNFWQSANRLNWTGTQWEDTIFGFGPNQSIRNKTGETWNEGFKPSQINLIINCPIKRSGIWPDDLQMLLFDKDQSQSLLTTYPSPLNPADAANLIGQSAIIPMGAPELGMDIAVSFSLDFTSRNDIGLLVFYNNTFEDVIIKDIEFI